MSKESRARAMAKLPSVQQLIGRSFSDAENGCYNTLPAQLLMAWRTGQHKKYQDRAGQPFESFYHWLWHGQPQGCGLSGFRRIHMDFVITILTELRDTLAEHHRGEVNGLITELRKHHGASKGKGGRPKNDDENLSRTAQVSNGRGGTHAKRSSSLAGRMAESSDPRIKAAWEAFLAGQHRSVTAAAIACGLRDDANAPLPRLKQFWAKASKADRKAFLAWLKEQDD